MDSLAILSTLERRFSLGLKDEECERLAALPPAARRGALTMIATNSLRRVLWLQMALWLEKADFEEELGMLMGNALGEPGLTPILKASSKLAEGFREQVARVFGLRFEGANLAPLYVRQYASLHEDIARLIANVDSEEGGLAVSELDEKLLELFHFLGSTLQSSVIQARYSDNGALVAKVIFGAQMESFKGLKGLGHYAAGAFLAGPDGSISSLNPFFLYADKQKMQQFDGYQEGRLNYKEMGKEGKDGEPPIRPADPEHALAWATIFLRFGSLHRAYVLLQELESENRVALITQAAVNHALKARQHRGAGQHARAIAELDLAIRSRADIAYFYFTAADSCLKNQDLRGAAALYNRLLEAFPACERGYLSLGEVLEQRGELPKAIRSYEKVLAFNPHSAAALQKRRRAEERLRAGDGDQVAGGPAPGGGDRSLAREFLQDLTTLAERKQLAPRLGGEETLHQLIEILCCKERSSALVLGDPGVGKSSLVEELVRRMADGDVPPRLKGRRVLMMSIATLLAGAKFRGQFEERMIALIEEIKKLDCILVIDHLHTLVSSGITRGGSLDAANLLKPALSRGEVQIIGISGHEDFSAVLEKDPGLMRSLQIIRLSEPSSKQAREIAAFCRGRFEEFHGVQILDEAVREAVSLAKLNLKERALPDSALQILDRASARANLAGSPSVDRKMVAATVAAIAGVAIERIRLGGSSRLARLEPSLTKRVRGQEEAIRLVSRVLRTTRMGFKTHPRRPEGVFLFVGPTGVGKTELSRAIAEVLIGDENRLIRIDMSEYMERINASRLIGTAPGYIGYNDPNQLTDQVRKNPFSVILFDEIEKADASVLNLFLQIFDAGRLTDGRGRTVSFHHATIIMTSNIGTHLFSRKRMGYGNRGTPKVERTEMIKEVKQFFPPEFLNRLDEIVVFDPLTPPVIHEIIDLQLKTVRRRLAAEGKSVRLTDEAAHLIADGGYSFEYGARNLSRVLRREFLDPLAELALTASWRATREIVVEVEEGKPVIRLIAAPATGETELAATHASAEAVMADGADAAAQGEDEGAE